METTPEKKYQLKPTPIIAKQFLPSDHGGLPGGVKRNPIGHGYTWSHIDYGTHAIYATDWIVTLPGGEMVIMHDAEFKARCEEREEVNL